MSSQRTWVTLASAYFPCLILAFLVSGIHNRGWWSASRRRYHRKHDSGAAWCSTAAVHLIPFSHFQTTTRLPLIVHLSPTIPASTAWDSVVFLLIYKRYTRNRSMGEARYDDTKFYCPRRASLPHQYTTKTPYAEGVELSQGANSLYLPNRQREEKKKNNHGTWRGGTRIIWHIE